MDEKLINYIMEQVNCSKEQAEAYLEAENEFFIENGVDIDFDELDEEAYDAIPETDYEEFAAYIAQRTGLTANMIEGIADAETDFLEKFNV